MSNQLKLADLRARDALAWRSAVALVKFTLLALLIMLMHVELGAGRDISDVHVPYDWVKGFGSFSFPFGEPYDVGLGSAKFVQLLLLSVVVFGQLGFIGVLIWALIKKQKGFVKLSLFILALIAIFAPVPKLFVAGTAQAVSVETAEQLLTQKQDERIMFRVAPIHEMQVKTYVRAQIAYAKGDLKRARALALKVNLASLGSPIEAPYRLQFLKGHYENLTTVCFVNFGCLSEQQRRARFAVFAWIALALSLAAFASAAVGFFLTRRLERLDALLNLSQMKSNQTPSFRSIGDTLS